MSRSLFHCLSHCRALGLVLTGALAGTAHADAEHDRIGAARATANAKLADQERECATRFVVSSCVEAARSEHRATLAALRQQELQLDEARRSSAAAARRKAIAERVDAQAARASEARPEAPSVRVRQGAEPAQRVEREAAPAASRPSAAERAELERRNEAKFEARALAAKAHREAIEQRNAQRASKGKVAAPLPAPSAASAAH
jgi:hypothetical protein